MSYAIRNDGTGWRAVASDADCGPDETFSAEQPALIERSEPVTISALDGLLALDAAGLSSDYDTWANSVERTFVERAFINKAMTWRRDDPTLDLAAVALGLSSQQVDALFVAAATP